MNRDINPVMALNPYTGKLMNVEPLFRIIKEGGEYNIIGIDDVIKYLTQVEYNEHIMHMLERFDSVQDIFYFLYMLKNLFKELAECEITLPNKKGS